MQPRFNIYTDSSLPAVAGNRKRVLDELLVDDTRKHGGVLRAISNADPNHEIRRKPLEESKAIRQALCPDSKAVCQIDSAEELPIVHAAKKRQQSIEEDPKPFDDKFFTDLYNDSHFAHLLQMERKIRPRCDYMSRQRDISATMRCVLVDWLIEVNQEYQQSNETLFLTVSLIDRFLSLMSVVRTKLQLVGAAASLVAAKVEEIFPPQIADLVYITDDAFTSNQIIRMEALLLKNLDFEVGDAHAAKFVNLLAVRSQADAKVAHMAQYLCEMTLLDYDALYFKSSEIATAALLLASLYVTNGLENSMKETIVFTGIDSSRLQTTVTYLHNQRLKVQSSSFTHKTIPRKYASKKYSQVSTIPITIMIPEVPDLTSETTL